MNLVELSFIPVDRRREAIIIADQRTLIIPKYSVPKIRAVNMLKMKRKRPERVYAIKL